ncbi:MAG: cellulose biosynthesis cyclic di-GMP-binding regulatory protein BcsB [Clostridium sp.]|uniref:cellulose biosynthesis cyclic di-GMP-binding regulatory protein BcsB n=1 Tax=Clostridium sp. TaxID=1506 RepID=UPI0025C6BBD3|nr:cellulose biosynthesis cyclic di-GMP-binding regulatory protein BcsB [Clostridium sp.]MCE5221609.1 cellulose biosynthesis cyclic di-GMP-binding regulatory protein BcsB [Clostridium sp.]
MKKIINIINILFLAIIFSLSIGIGIYAAPKGDNIEQNVNTKSYNLSNDVIFTGAFSSYSTYFNVDEWWKNTKVEAQVNFCINQLIEENQKAYIKLSVNGTPFYSQGIFYKSYSEEQQIKVAIPEELLKVHSNQLKIETYLRTSELSCVDDVNLANWFVIKKSTNIKATFNNIISNNKISDFPYPFLKNQDNNQNLNDLSIVIPDDYSDSELSAAFILNSYLEKLNDTYENKITIVKYSDFAKNENTNGIFIGGYNNLKNEFGVESSKNTDCLIKVLNSPYSANKNNKTMVILCDDNDNLIKGIKTLQNKELVYQLDSDTFNVTSDFKEETVPKIVSGKVAFKDIGISEIQLKGSFRRESTISYSIPKNRIFSQRDKIKLFMRYSENLDFEKSLVTVYINNTPIGSKKLEKEKCSQDEVELKLPNDVSNTNYLDIKIAFDLELTNSYCEKRQEEMPWALVTGDSYLYLGNNDINDYYFSTYSAPFVKDEMFNDTAMIVPDALSSDEINSLGKVVGYLGKDVAYNNGDFKVVRSSAVSDSDKKKNIIIYGMPKTNKLISTINDELWFKYDENYSKFLSNEKLVLTDSFSSTISNFQLDISKFNDQKAMLVLTSPDSEILKNSLSYLSSATMVAKLNGDCAIIDKYGDIKTYKMKKETQKPAYEKLEALDGNAKAVLIIAGLFVIFVASATALYFFKNNKNSKLRK